ncbi:MAG: DNA repair protein RadA [Lachnospiraceae bacterium]|nr:DNA repair protein RadA [Lachnospiraceae bacterium]
MAKGKNTVFFCQNCGYESAKWLGQCPGCREWNTFVEEPAAPKGAGGSGGSWLGLAGISLDGTGESRRTAAGAAADAGKSGRTGNSDGSGTARSRHAGACRNAPEPISLSRVEMSGQERFSTGIGELDRVLGGGIVPGSLVLVGGDPGIGKSTLLLQVCRNLSAADRSVLYISGEESLQQIRIRAERIGSFSDSLKLLCETNLENVANVLQRERPKVAIIDSVQTMYSENASSTPGSVSQIRQATGLFLQLAKLLNITIFLVGHVTKEGVVAGPRVLEHMVDSVLYFEGDRHVAYRVLRGVKNRFGSTNEIGVFEMRGEGLVEVPNPSEYMLSGRPEGASGSVVACSIEGTRPILVEIQALICKTGFGLPRRTAAGADLNRVNLLLAVLEKRADIHLSSSDAYVNIAGGVRMNEPAIDLGIVLAVVSSYKDIPISDRTICFGEVGLSGEVRSVSMALTRVQEAKKLGFERCILPKVCVTEQVRKVGIEIVGVSNVREAIGWILK